MAETGRREADIEWAATRWRTLRERGEGTEIKLGPKQTDRVNGLKHRQ